MRRGIVLALAGFVVACRKAPPADLADAAPPPSLQGDARAGSERASDGAWLRAGEGDPIDLERLAEREGSAGLLEGLEEGGAIGRTALAALPYADDAELVYARLAEILRLARPADLPLVVEAAAGIAQRPRRQAEPLDPPGARACAAALVEVAKRDDAPGALRADAVSAARFLAERGAIASGMIPTDLDPK